MSSLWPTSTATPGTFERVGTWPGRTPRSSCTTRHRRRRRRTCSSGSPTGSCTRTRRSGLAQRCWPRTPGCARALGPRHLGRPADHPRSDRRDRGRRHRPAVAARPRVLAAEAPRRRSRDRQRARRDLHPKTCRTRSKDSCGRASRASAASGHPSPAASSSCAANRSAPRTERCSRAAARAVLLSQRGSLGRPGARLERPASRRSRLLRVAAARARARERRPRRRGPSWSSSTACGGFDERRPRVRDRRWARASRRPPPWLNVIANPSFGFQVSESGAGYTWSENSRENQLTPWSQRSGDATRRARRSTSATTTAASCGRRPPLPIRCAGSHVRGASRRRLQPLRARARTGIELEPRPVRPARRRRQDLAC